MEDWQAEGRFPSFPEVMDYLKRIVEDDMNVTFKVGSEVQDRPWLLESTRFQSLMLKVITSAFNLKPGFSEPLHRGEDGASEAGKREVLQHGKAVQVDIRLTLGRKRLVVNQLIVHPFQSSGFRLSTCTPTT